MAVVQAQAEHLPFLDGSFDRILIVDAIHHLADVPRALAEVCRLLRQPDPTTDNGGGRLVIEEPNIEDGKVKLIALIERLLMTRSRFYSPGDMVKMLGDCPVQVQVKRQGANAWIVAQRIHDP